MLLLPVIMNTYNSPISINVMMITPARVVLNSLTSLSDILFLFLSGKRIVIIIPRAIADNSMINSRIDALKILIFLDLI